MSRAPLLLIAAACALFLPSCANRSGPNSDYDIAGPFDAEGNYRDDWADDPTKWRRPDQGKTKQVANTDEPPSNATPITSSPAPAPRPVVKPKPKPRPKPQPVRYTVKKGDNLYTIAKRNRTTVGALQRANGIKGSLIVPGQRLVIPR